MTGYGEGLGLLSITPPGVSSQQLKTMTLRYVFQSCEAAMLTGSRFNHLNTF